GRAHLDVDLLRQVASGDRRRRNGGDGPQGGWAGGGVDERGRDGRVRLHHPRCRIDEDGRGRGGYRRGRQDHGRGRGRAGPGARGGDARRGPDRARCRGGVAVRFHGGRRDRRGRLDGLRCGGG